MVFKMATNFYEIIGRLTRKNRVLIVVFVLFIVFIWAAYFAFKRFYSDKKSLKPFKDVANNNANGLPVQIYFFYVDWCPHCKTALPEWRAFKEEYDGQKINDCDIECVEVNCTDKENDDSTLQEFHVSSFPTVFLLKEDVKVDYDAKITKKSLEQFVQMTTKE
jgi:thiol-disulfide isomerase/thioredoxin